MENRSVTEIDMAIKELQAERSEAIMRELKEADDARLREKAAEAARQLVEQEVKKLALRRYHAQQEVEAKTQAVLRQHQRAVCYIPATGQFGELGMCGQFLAGGQPNDACWQCKHAYENLAWKQGKIKDDRNVYYAVPLAERA